MFVLMISRMIVPKVMMLFMLNFVFVMLVSELLVSIAGLCKEVFSECQDFIRRGAVLPISPVDNASQDKGNEGGAENREKQAKVTRIMGRAELAFPVSVGIGAGSRCPEKSSRDEIETLHVTTTALQSANAAMGCLGRIKVIRRILSPLRLETDEVSSRPVFELAYVGHQSTRDTARPSLSC